MKLDPNFKVPITKVLKIEPHPNPEVLRLEIATVYGFQVIIGKGNYKIGDKVVYLPINSILPGDIENFLFPPDAKVKLEKSRLKAAKIRGFVSQGMIAPWEDIKKLCNLDEYDLETDIQEELRVFKYYPPSRIRTQTPADPNKKPRNKPHENQYFKQYKGCVNIKWEPNAFSEENDVWISEKIHGSNFRCGWLPFTPPEAPPEPVLTKWQKLKKTVKGFFKKEVPPVPVVWPEFEFCFGSNTVQRQHKLETPTWYGKDIYMQMCEKYNLKEKLKNFPGLVVFGEIYGPTVQKGYHYGLQNDDKDLILFDIMMQSKTDTNWMSCDLASVFSKEILGVQFVPVLYKGKFNNKVVEELTKGNSAFCPEQKVREGIVIKNNDILNLNRKKIKVINPDYLMKEADGETSDVTEEDVVDDG